MNLRMLLRYMVAAGLTCIALLALVFIPAVRPTPFLFFILVVAVSARYLGFGPAVFSTLTAAVLLDYFVFHPSDVWSLTPPDVVRLGSFVLVCLMIASLSRQRKQATEAAAESEKRLAAIVESSEDAILSETLDGIVMSWNRGAERLYGYTESEMLGRDIREIFPPDKADEFPRVMNALRRGEGVRNLETVRIHKNGTPVPVSVSVSALRSPSGEIVGASIIARDITMKKKAEEAISTAERRLQAAHLAGNMGAWDWNIQTGDLWWSEGIPALHGFSREELSPSFENWMNSVAEEDRAAVIKCVEEAVASNKPYNVSYLSIWPDGSRHWIEARGQVLLDGEGKPHRMIGIGIDVTARRLAEESLRRSEKLAAAGRLAASIAHEINNPLEAVTNLLYILRGHPSLDQQAREYVLTAESELQRVSHIAKQTLGFYRDSSAPSAVSVAATAEAVLELYARKINFKGIKVESRLDREAQILGFQGEIRQLLANLVVNAIDALPAGGTLAVRVARCHQFGAESSVRITVADSGVGIPKSELGHIFEAFYTTKKDVGTGLGLWVTQSIVQKHGGRVKVRSSTVPGHTGTVFSIFLPEVSRGSRAASSLAN